jgi:signal transduction histidine kinase
VVEARQAAERIISDGHRAGDVIRSVRELATKSSHKVAPLDFGQLIGESLGHMAGELRQHEITLELDLPLNFPLVQGDRVQLQQVILNLVKNGIEAMSATFGQPRVLRIGLESRGTTTVLITVADTGIGLDPMRMRQMFDGFFTTKLDGIGLGLSICRSIVERHGGRLWASANHPYGSLLIFTLPVEATSCGHGDEVSTTG